MASRLIFETVILLIVENQPLNREYIIRAIWRWLRFVRIWKHAVWTLKFSSVYNTSVLRASLPLFMYWICFSCSALFPIMSPEISGHKYRRASSKFYVPSASWSDILPLDAVTSLNQGCDGNPYNCNNISHPQTCLLYTYCIYWGIEQTKHIFYSTNYSTSCKIIQSINDYFWEKEHQTIVQKLLDYNQNCIDCNA